MSDEGFPERFERVRARHGPLCWGFDPSPEILEAWGCGDSPQGLECFVDVVLEAAVGAVGIVKPQVAFFERHGWEGFRALQRLIEGAQHAGLLVINDAKRGDVGSTNDAYAEAFLGPDAPFPGDALTVHPYLGLAAMEVFVRRAHDNGRGLFVVVRSSNPEGRDIQTAVTGTGRTVEQFLLDRIGEINGLLAPGCLGPVGAVVGPTHGDPPLDLVDANALFLAPGVGAQGASPANVQSASSRTGRRRQRTAVRPLHPSGLATPNCS